MTFLSVLAIIQSNAGIYDSCNEVRMGQEPARSPRMDARTIESTPTHGNGFEVHKISQSTFVVDPGGVCKESGGFMDDHHSLGKKERNDA